jgi:diphosphate-dependent phosphofructokinase
MKTLTEQRQHYQTLIPHQCCHPKYVVPIQDAYKPLSEDLIRLFPLTSQKNLRRLSFPVDKILKVGVLFSGGQAPGGHNVIAGLWDVLQQLNPASQLIGFLDGPNGFLTNQILKLTKNNIAPYRNQGGFDLLGSGRTKIETPEQLLAAAQTARNHDLDGLVIIGGDDSNTNAAFLAEYFCQQQLNTRVIGIPKTIDGDLKNEAIELSFGFDTASKIYAEIIGNLARDALSAKKYYFFVKLMGRTASHLTLECALRTQINLALIGEEIAEEKLPLQAVVKQIVDLICERAELGKNYGVILIPEGLLEFIPDCQQLIQELNQQAVDPSFELSPAAKTCLDQFPLVIQDQLRLDRDAHGNVQVSKIETERLLINLVEKELKNRRDAKQYKGKFNPQPFFCGYEGRAGFPTNFDCSYCYTLGYGAGLLIQQGVTGVMCCVQQLAQSIDHWQLTGVPIVEILQFENRKGKMKAVIQKALVYLKSPPFALFSIRRKNWRLQDSYLYPGPIQFEGCDKLINSLPYLLSLSK